MKRMTNRASLVVPALLLGTSLMIGTTVTWNRLEQVGDDWRQYFALGTDRTHLNPTGAGIVSDFVRDAIAEQKLKLGDYLR